MELFVLVFTLNYLRLRPCVCACAYFRNFEIKFISTVISSVGRGQLATELKTIEDVRVDLTITSHFDCGLFAQSLFILNRWPNFAVKWNQNRTPNLFEEKKINYSIE